MLQIKVKKLYPDALLPTKSHDKDTGWDIYAIEDGEIIYTNTDGKPLYIEYNTGLSIQPPEGYDIKIFTRSSVSNFCLVLANSVGIADETYSGPYKLRFRITHDMPCRIYRKGDKIGQLVLQKREDAEIVEVNELSQTDRGSSGFGSTGK